MKARFATNRRIHVVNVAVAAEPGSATFYVNGLPSTNSLLPRPASGHRYFPAAGVTQYTLTVPTISLDQYRSDHQIPVPQILKMDIQGGELQALRGAEQTLSSGDVAVIFSEVSFVPHYEGGVLFAELAAHLADRGFTLFNFYELLSAEMGQLRFGDAIFVSERLRRDVVVSWFSVNWNLSSLALVI